ncbi:MAG: DUF1501 domain-containing protein [Opitutae bacterium]|jgi:hypothetical protein|nr:DUF1501 domain-containing protein [Opitutae bacterium]MBT5380522.1 DUF1501 domain-containing protein [Opitutae bacterium]MBT5693163.1 DUF1501 domain-containing protein [Opitutae bacterium]MBT6957388.1 DUF1501 domain-containing protein [Opitutae bacterium]MBT7854188.1 DUF1501 domain-containing protein [Opitutae bacterium]
MKSSSLQNHGCKEYHVNRRQVIQGAGVATLLGMPIRNLLAQKGAVRPPTADHVILFRNGGGMTHIDTWDPKPGRPTAGPFNAINTSADGIQISEIFPQLARQMKHASLIRSITSPIAAHGLASYLIQTSYTPNNNVIHPGIGSIAAHERHQIGALPAFVSINGNAQKAGYLGQKCEAYFIGRPGEKDPYLSFPAGISKVRGTKRLEILERMNNRKSSYLGAPEMKDVETSVDDAVALMQSPALKSMEIDNDNPDLQRYGDTDFGRASLLARNLVESGVRFVQINRGGFDNHGNIEDAMLTHGEVMDPAMASLIEDLNIRGMLDRTMIVMVSEFGRTPRVNGNAGRDHWSRVFSGFFAGGGVKKGHVIGASDKDGMYPDKRPVKPQDIPATICHALGADWKKTVITPQERPFKLTKDGSDPVFDLFA